MNFKKQRDGKGRFVTTSNYQAAVMLGEKFYIGQDCPKKHGGLRYVSNNGCVECLKEQCRKYHYAHIDKNRARLREYAKKDKTGNVRRSAEYYSRVSKADGQLGKAKKKKLYAELGPMCHWCGKDTKGNYHIDHIKPLIGGGDNHKENLCISCPECNLSKGTKSYV